jgi:hypothetical protein
LNLNPSKERQELKKKGTTKKEINEILKFEAKKEVQPGVVCLHPPNVIFRERIRLEPNQSPTAS